MYKDDDDDNDDDDDDDDDDDVNNSNDDDHHRHHQHHHHYRHHHHHLRSSQACLPFSPSKCHVLVKYNGLPLFPLFSSRSLARKCVAIIFL